ncbi:uncharacterized protein QC761_112530 [Podospora bellae-mahoneyi]|uniref:Cyanovirin-N domain-containing protein n=1 Tax=Podospora bellae-mahoneyi TaxID=2093777 RepID=A0ABR0FZ22_9PEZI|nr:hypothetical protein QC761_112530 [Podospora bellae-mahoneyi]
MGTFSAYPVLTATVLLLGLVFPLLTSGEGGFTHDCAYAGANLTDKHHWIGVYCLNDDVDIYGFNYSMLDLDHCAGNNAGQLVVYENGNYSGSCENCTFIHDKSLHLSCLCWDMNGGHTNSTLDLNTTLYDSNGAVGCYSFLGNKTWEPAPDS